MSRIQVKCETCKTPFSARQADRKRGWARFCSKSCKAIKQTQRLGYSYINNDDVGEDAHPFSSEGLGQWD